MNTHRIVSALVVAFSLIGCAAAPQEETQDPNEDTATHASALGVLPGRPGPDTGGVLPTTFVPPVDPLRDPTEGNVLTPGWAKGVVVGDAPLPWKVLNPAEASGCRCHMECGPQNDDGSKDCITVCYGTGC